MVMFCSYSQLLLNLPSPTFMFMNSGLTLAHQIAYWIKEQG